MTIYRVIVEDITTLNVDAIVNPSNTEMLPSTGINGHIHSVAGPQLQVACDKLGGCELGEVKATLGYRIAATHVLHCPIPTWFGDQENETQLLAQIYRSIIEESINMGLTSIALPSLATGLAQFPHNIAAEIAVSTIQQSLMNTSTIESVFFVCTDSKDVEAYNDLLMNLI